MASGPVDHGREPCPHRILDDCGSAFGMGAVGGGVWYLVKGLKNSPPGARVKGALEAAELGAYVDVVWEHIEILVQAPNRKALGAALKG